MAEIQRNSVTIDSVMSRLEHYKFNPADIQRPIFDVLEEITDGQVKVMDATTPFTYLLSSIGVMSAVALQEMQSMTRKLYPSLNQLDEDLYLHMSDKDFIDRFATPLDVDFTFIIPMTDIRNKMVYDTSENAYKAIIPRDTSVSVNETAFTMQYPVVIRLYDNGSIKVSYDVEIQSPVRDLTTNIIISEERTLQDGTKVLMFTVPMKQYGIRMVSFPIQRGLFFNQEIQFNDQFYYARVFQRNSQTNNLWEELKTTHTEQVFDLKTPTAVLKVLQNSVIVSIPPVYVNTDLVAGDIRVDVYSTKGEITMNLGGFLLNSFTVNMTAIDTARDLNEFTQAMTNISFGAYNDTTVSGGKSSISYEQLRERIINNATGPIQLPITNVQLETDLSNSGFELIKNVDLVTNRLFLAARNLPRPLNQDLLTAANIGILTYIGNVNYLKTLDSVADNGDRVTLFSNNLFENKNGILRLLERNEIDSILALQGTGLVSEVNNRNFVYTPFHYVLDNTENQFAVRAYNLDQPKVAAFSFVSHNETAQFNVNTGIYEFKKTQTGYEFWVMTKSDTRYQDVPESAMQLQMAVKPDGENAFAYLNGVYQFTNAEGERAYKFVLETNHDIDKEDLLTITNFNMFVTNNPDIKVKLTDEFHLFFTTTSVNIDFVPNEDDLLIGKFMLPPNAICITHESAKLTLGYALKNLWSRARNLAAGLEYQRHTVDVPMLYTQRVYEKDPVTGSIISGFDGNNAPIYNVLHEIGDPVLDEDGNQVYKHRVGDVVLDPHGDPVISSAFEVEKEFDLLMIDGRYYFANDRAFTNYRSELVKIITDWIIDDLFDFQQQLLEQSWLYFFPKTTIGSVIATADGEPNQRLQSEQSLKLKLYVPESVYKSASIRRQIESNTAVLLDSYLAQPEINTNIIIQELKKLFGDSVEAVSLSGLGGQKNYTLVQVNNEHNRLCLKKKLVLQPDGKFIIKEDIEVEFFNLTQAV